MLARADFSHGWLSLNSLRTLTCGLAPPNRRSMPAGSSSHSSSNLVQPFVQQISTRKVCASRSQTQAASVLRSSRQLRKVQALTRSLHKPKQTIIQSGSEQSQVG